MSDLVWGSKVTPSLIQAVLRDFVNLQVAHGSTIALLEQNGINGAMPKQTFLNEVQRILLDYEIRKNAAKFRLLQQENDDNKVDTSGDFVISTIHSAKGLEFPNVCVIYTGTNHMEEADKRMYYVAFTRATKTMLVAAFDNLKYPVIQANYESLKEALKKNPIYNVTPTVTNVPPSVTLPPDDDTLPWDTDKIA